MKSFINVFAALAVILLCTAASCKKDKDPIDQLPPETQTGANTFGCLVNGSVFKPKDNGSLLPTLSSFYQLIYPSPIGYVFGLNASNRSGATQGTVYMNIDSTVVEEGKTYFLTKLKNGNAGGGFTNGIDFNSKVYETTEKVTGELVIKKFDKINQIVAGTFWYKAVNAVGDTVKITNGRFDVKYTR